VAPVAFTQYPRGPDIMGYSVRDERWRYTEWRERRSGDVVARELYDHAESPVTARNLAADPHYAGEVARLALLLAGKFPRASVPVAQPHSNTQSATSR
jgi:iduronate 2-sulfatase